MSENSFNLPDLILVDVHKLFSKVFQGHPVYLGLLLVFAASNFSYFGFKQYLKQTREIHTDDVENRQNLHLLKDRENDENE